MGTGGGGEGSEENVVRRGDLRCLFGLLPSFARVTMIGKEEGEEGEGEEECRLV